MLKLDATHAWLPLGGATIIAAFTFGAYSSIMPIADAPVTLSGDQQVPPVRSEGSGTGTVVVARDRSVNASVTTTGIVGTEAHIHEAGSGKNGPAIIPLTKESDTFVTPPGARLTEKQLASFMAGNLYVNVHTAANPGGEVRGQLMPR